MEKRSNGFKFMHGELKLDALFKLIWQNKKTYVYVLLATFVLSAGYAVSLPRYYETKVLLAPEYSSGSSSLGSIGGLASLAGINLGNMGGEDAIVPSLYPDLISSTDFLISMFDVQIVTRDTSYTGTLRQYMETCQKEAWWTEGMSWMKNLFQKKKQNDSVTVPDPFQLTKEETILAQSIGKKLNCLVDKKTNVITLTVTDQDPLVSALLVDTYDVVNSGVPNAIKVFKELHKAGHEPVGIRIDSGDIAQLASKARKMLDDAGFPNAKITASNALDAHIVKALLDEGAPLDNFGIGERLITSSSSPVLSGVYKMSALKNNGKWVPKIKISNSREKITLPGNKQVYRLYDKNNPNQAIADVIALDDEKIGSKITAFNADFHVTKNKVILTDFISKPLLSQVLTPEKSAPIETDTFAIQKFAKKELDQLPAATKRLINPDRFPVYLTKKLFDLQQKLISEYKNI